MMKKASRFGFGLLLAIAVIVTMPSSSALAAKTTVSGTVNGGATVNVAPSANISASVTGTITGSDNWRSTGWSIRTTPPGANGYTCSNGANHTSPGTYTENFNITAPNTPGVYNVYFRISGSNGNCNSDTGTIVTLANAVTVGPDLTVTKTNNLLGDDATIGVPFNWILTIANNGASAATFSNNDVVLRDQLPSTGATYGTPTVSFAGGASGSTVTCNISAGNALNCISHNPHNDNVAIPVGGTMTVTIPVTPTENGTLTNPRSGGRCEVDPTDQLRELSNSNNDCNTNTVNVVQTTGTITIVKNTVGGEGTFDFDLTGNSSATSTRVVTASSTGSQVVTLTAGTYAVSETALAGWTLTESSCDNGTPSEITLSPGGSITCTFVNTRKGHLIVQKTTIPAADTTSFEVGISGTGAITGNASGTVSDAIDQDYEVAPGVYSVSEAVATGWDMTENTCADVTVGAGETKYCTITNTKRGSLTIQKLTDPDATIGTFHVVVTNASGTVGESDLITGEEGESEEGDPSSFTIPNLLAGDYQITEATSTLEGWDFTRMNCGTNGEELLSNGGTYTLEAGEDATCTIVNTQRGSITIHKIASPNEGLFGFTLSGAMNATTTILGTGDYTFSNLIPGNYTIDEVLPEGWAGTQTARCEVDGNPDPRNGFELEPGMEVDCTFNNTEFGVITGKKFKDKDADGRRDRGDVSLAGWTIALTHTVTSTGDDAILASSEQVLTQTMTSRGGYSFKNLEPGVYHVCEIMQPNWFQSLPVSGSNYTCPTGQNYGATGYQIEVRAGEIVGGNNFGNYKQGSIAGRKFNDLNANGRRNPGEPLLSDWTIQLYREGIEAPVNSVTTNANGRYKFDNLTPGNYMVREVQQEGWMQTAPSEPSYWNVRLRSGQKKTGKSFGNYQPATISGYKWEDTNGNGSKDGEESYLNGWTIKLSNGAEYVTGSNEGPTGYYEFTGLIPGTYTVSEVQKEGWNQTLPGGESQSYSIELTAGQNSPDHNFGNQMIATEVDLSLEKTVTNEHPTPGAVIDYAITVTNDTELDIDATGIKVSDILPSGVTLVEWGADQGEYNEETGTWLVGTLESGDDATLVLTVRVNNEDEIGTVITNTATTVLDQTDVDTENNSDSASFTVTAPGNEENSSSTNSGNSGGNIAIAFFQGGGGPQGGNGGGGQVLGASTSTEDQGGNTSTSTTTAPTATSCSPYLSSYLGLSRKNDPEQVKKLQVFLNKEMSLSLPLDSIFGNAVFAAVKALQLKYYSDILAPWETSTTPKPFPATGFVGKYTLAKINALTCAMPVK